MKSLCTPIVDSDWLTMVIKSLNSMPQSKNRICANHSSENPVKVDANLKEISFTYSLSWEETSVPFKDRWKKYLDSEFFEHKVKDHL